MNQKQLEELMKMNENNQAMEATFFEVQKSFTLIAKQAKHLFDECVNNGFTEEQALRLTIGMFTGSGK